MKILCEVLRTGLYGFVYLVVRQRTLKLEAASYNCTFLLSIVIIIIINIIIILYCKDLK